MGRSSKKIIFLSMARCGAFFVAALLVFLSLTAWAQHKHENMPGMKQKQPTPTPTPQKQTAPQKNMQGMKEMPTPSPMPTATPSPSQLKEEMLGMRIPAASQQPSAAPEKMAMPEQSPSPTANQTPMGTKQTESGGNMNMTGSAKPASGSNAMGGMNMKETGAASGMGAMNMGSVLVMSGDEMGVRVGKRASSFIPIGQMGSGTSWQPASTPMYMWHKVSGDWLLMFHGEAKIGVNSQGGLRGVTKFESQNWLMPMALRRLGPGTLELRAMFSLEPFTFAPGGSPELFQTGETYRGQPLINRQHPHDLFMELSATYTVALSERAKWFAYFGYPGEPALGPVAFMHRASASENPAAPLSHHLQDSTHISFGVFTTGFTYRWFKLEGSVFNGREPDENRYNFEAHRWNSRAARLSFAPGRNWTMQLSHALLRSPEALEPGDVRRTTASLMYNRNISRGNWATSFIWGRNHESHGGEIFRLNGYTAESTVNFLDKNYLYTRLELADKNQLLTEADLTRLGIKVHHPVFRIGAYTFGGARDIWTTEKIKLALGADVTFYSKPDALDVVYGENPASFHFFLRLRPGQMKMDHSGHNMTGGMNSQP